MVFGLDAGVAVTKKADVRQSAERHSTRVQEANYCCFRKHHLEDRQTSCGRYHKLLVPIQTGAEPTKWPWTRSTVLGAVEEVVG